MCQGEAPSSNGMLDDLEAADYDTTKVDPEALFAEAAAADPEFEPALGRVGAYTEEKCEA